MDLLEDKGGRPDRNEIDPRVGPGKVCLIYGFDPNNPNTGPLNGRQCMVHEKVIRSGNIFFPFGETWYACSVYGLKGITNLRADHLMVTDDSDVLVIEKMRVDK